MENLEDKIRFLQKQQEEIVFNQFNEIDSWNIGCILREKAVENNYAITISITLNRRNLFYCAMPNTTPINHLWIKRKENTVYKFFKSSYEMSLYMQLKEDSLAVRYGLNHNDYGAAGGCVPIVVKGVGVVGTIGVSGLKEDEDHDLVIDTILQYKNNVL